MIKVEDLWKSYEEQQVLKGLCLQVEEGETLVILGRSGVGKSVLLRQIIGIEKPDKGYVEVAGYRVTDMDLVHHVQILRTMGMLFQGGALFDSMNVGQNVAFYLNQHSSEMNRSEIEDFVAHALELVGLPGTQKKMPSELSGGMRKRAALARLIVYRPSYILYDEPNTGLDPITSMQINELIRWIQKELKATSIVVTHDMRSAIEVGDRLAFHHDGKILHVATPKDFLMIKDPIVERFFNDALVTDKLLAAKGLQLNSNSQASHHNTRQISDD